MRAKVNNNFVIDTGLKYLVHFEESDIEGNFDELPKPQDQEDLFYSPATIGRYGKDNIKITYKISQDSKAYRARDREEKTITLERTYNAETEKYEFKNMTDSGNVEVIFDEENQKIIVTEMVDVKLTLNIKLQDVTGSPDKIKNVSFNLEANQILKDITTGLESKNILTDESGKYTTQYTPIVPNSVIEFTLNQNTSTVKFDALQEQIKIRVEFDTDCCIKNCLIIQGSQEYVSYIKDNDFESSLIIKNSLTGYKIKILNRINGMDIDESKEWELVGPQYKINAVQDGVPDLISEDKNLQADQSVEIIGHGEGKIEVYYSVIDSTINKNYTFLKGYTDSYLSNPTRKIAFTRNYNLTENKYDFSILSETENSLQSKGIYYEVDEEAEEITIYEEYKPNLSINLTTVDGDDGSPISGVEYQIQQEDSQEIKKFNVTDTDGKTSIDMEHDSGIQVVQYTITQLSTLNDINYEDNSEIKLIVYINQRGEVINCNVRAGHDFINVNYSNLDVNLKISFYKIGEQYITMKVIKKDIDNPSNTIMSSKYEITLPDGTVKDCDDSGIYDYLSMKLTNLKQGDNIIKVREKEAPGGYKIINPETIKIQVNINQNKIYDVNIIKDGQLSKELKYEFYKVAEVNIKSDNDCFEILLFDILDSNEPEENQNTTAVGDYNLVKLELKKKDVETFKVLPGSEYEVTLPNGSKKIISDKDQYVITDITDLSEGINKVYIKEIVTANGYEIINRNSVELQIDIHEGYITSAVLIDNGREIYNIRYRGKLVASLKAVNKDDNFIKVVLYDKFIGYESEPEEDETSTEIGEYGLVKLELQKKDIDNFRILPLSEYIVKQPDGTSMHVIDNDKYLIVDIENLSEGRNIISIREIKTYNGYIILNSRPVEIAIDINEGYITSAKILYNDKELDTLIYNGDPVAKIRKVNNADNYMKVAFYDKYSGYYGNMDNGDEEDDESDIISGEPNLVKFALEKRNLSTGERIGNSEYEVTMPDGTKTTVIDENNKLILDINIKNEGKNTIYIQETKAPDGYKIINPNPVEVCLNIENGYITTVKIIDKEIEKNILLYNNRDVARIRKVVENINYFKMTFYDIDNNAEENISNYNMDPFDLNVIEYSLEDGSRLKGIGVSIKVMGTDLKSNRRIVLQNSENVFTDNNGMVSVYGITAVGNITIYIDQVSISNNINVASNSLYLKIIRDPVTGKFELPEMNNVGTELSENRFDIFVGNSINTGVYNLKINSVDNDGNNIVTEHNSIFNILEPEEEVYTNAISSKDGIYEIENIAVPEIGEEDIVEVNYTITEEKAPNGYRQNNETIILTLYFDEYGLVDAETNVNDIYAEIISVDESLVELDIKHIRGDAKLLIVDPDGGNWEDSNEMQTFEGNAGEEKNIPDPEKEGFKVTFDGNGGSTIEAITQTILFSKWILTGSGSLVDNNYMFGEDDGYLKANYIVEDLYISEEKPTKENYLFKGWSKSSDGEVAYQPGDRIELAEDTTLYAIWGESIVIKTKEYAITTADENIFTNEGQTKYFQDVQLEENEYEQDDKYIIGIIPKLTTEAEENEFTKGTKLEDFIANIETNAESIKLYDADNNEITDGDTYLGTGMIVEFTKGTANPIRLTIITKGDINGDGILNLLDINRIKMLIRRDDVSITDTIEKFISLDVNLDGVINQRDMNNMKRSQNRDDVRELMK